MTKPAWHRTRLTLTTIVLAGLLPLAGCIDRAFVLLIRGIEYPEIEHQRQLRAKLPKPKPLIDPYRKPEPHVNPGPAIEPDQFDAADHPGLQLMSNQ